MDNKIPRQAQAVTLLKQFNYGLTTVDLARLMDKPDRVCAAALKHLWRRGKIGCNNIEAKEVDRVWFVAEPKPNKPLQHFKGDVILKSMQDICRERLLNNQLELVCGFGPGSF